MSIKCKLGFHSWTMWEHVETKEAKYTYNGAGYYKFKLYIYKRECTVCGTEKFKKTEA
jgi:hypothetical protein